MYDDQYTRNCDPMLGRGRGAAVAPGARAVSQACADWSGYCNQDEFAEVYDLVFDPFLTNAAAIPVVTAAGNQRDAIATVPQEGYFVVTEYTFVAIPTGVRWSAQIDDRGSQRIMMSDFVEGPNLAGTVQRPRVVYPPRLCAKESVMRVTIRNLDTVQITGFQFRMGGFVVLNKQLLNASLRGRCF